MTAAEQGSGSGPTAVTSARETTVRQGYHDRVRADVVPSVPRSTGTLLDVGGGTGATAVHLKHAGRAARAGTVDLVRPLTIDPDLDYQHIGNVEDDGFVADVAAADGPFDTVLCLDVLEHLVDPWSVVARLHEAMRPGGVLVASIPNVRHYRISGGLFFRNRWTLQDAGILDRTHLRFFVRETAIELLTHSGLVLDSVVAPLPERRTRLVKWVRRLAFGRLDSLVTVDWIIRVRKPA